MLQEVCWTILKHLLSVAREMLRFSESFLCKRLAFIRRKRLLQECCFLQNCLLRQPFTVLFRKCSLQEGCFSAQKVPVARGLLFSSESVLYKRAAVHS
jgi:hypothetical protein